MSEQTIRCQGDSEAQLLLENQICFPLYSAANAMIRAYRPLLDALDLTYSQYLVLLVLWQQNGINVKDLGAKLHLDSGTLTPLLKRLEAKGIVERRRGQTDETCERAVSHGSRQSSEAASPSGAAKHALSYRSQH